MDTRTGYHFGLRIEMSRWVLGSSKKRLRPLIADTEFLWCYYKGYLCRASYELDILESVARFPMGGRLDRLGRNFRPLERVFRLAPSNGIQAGRKLYFSRRSEIFVYDLDTGWLSSDFVIPRGRRALQLGLVGGADRFEKVVFGEYFHNLARKSVRIWGRSNSSNHWEVLGEFPEGEIEHIHAVVEIDEMVFILCGDFDHCASIWETDREFSFLRPLLRGNQSCRAAWIEKIGGTLIYATDSQLEKNHLRELRLDEGTPISNEVQSIEGSSIYCGKGHGNHFFSTTVEGGLPTGNFLVDSLDRRRGRGIFSSWAKIYSLDSDVVCEEVFSAKKDIWPFRLGQFGTFTFPSGVQPTGLVVAYATALSGIDDTCFVFRKCH